MARIPLTALALASLALAACTSEPPPAPPAPGPDTPVSSADPAPPPSRRVAPGEMFGQWTLVALTGEDLSRHHRVHLLIGRHRIEAVSQCVSFGAPLPGAPPEPPPPPGVVVPGPPPVCARMLNPVEQRLPQVLHGAERMERRGDGRVAFVGPRGEAVVERPTSPVVNPFENVPGPGPWLMWGAWRVAAVDGRPLPEGEPLRLLFRTRSIEVQSGCVAMGWLFEQDGDRLAIGAEAQQVDVCERARSREETALAAIFRGDLRIARSTPTERLLTGRGGSVLLRR